MGVGGSLGWCELAGALTHLLQLQPHFVEGSQPVGLGPGHGILTFLAFLIFFWPETEARGILRHQTWLSLHPSPSTLHPLSDAWPFRDTMVSRWNEHEPEEQGGGVFIEEIEIGSGGQRGFSGVGGGQAGS